MSKVFRCQNCNKIEDLLFIGSDNKNYCVYCYDKLFFYCDVCNKLKCQEDSLDTTDYAETNGLFMVCKNCVKKNVNSLAGRKEFNKQNG